jgi:hypothetical protein
MAILQSQGIYNILFLHSWDTPSFGTVQYSWGRGSAGGYFLEETTRGSRNH